MIAHIWDSKKSKMGHQEFDGPGGSNRSSGGDSSSGNSTHATHVTGTIIGYGAKPEAKGMAPKAKSKNYDWGADASEAQEAAANGMLISNHSYGLLAKNIPDYWFGAYITKSRDWDEIMYNSPYYLMVVAAGNNGNENDYNESPLEGNKYYDKLCGHATSKNNLVVANGKDASVNPDGSLNLSLIHI